MRKNHLQFLHSSVGMTGISTCWLKNTFGEFFLQLWASYFTFLQWIYNYLSNFYWYLVYRKYHLFHLCLNEWISNSIAPDKVPPGGRVLPILEKLSTDCPMNSTTSWLARLILLTGLILSDLVGYQIYLTLSALSEQIIVTDGTETRKFVQNNIMLLINTSSH